MGPGGSTVISKRSDERCRIRQIDGTTDSSFTAFSKNLSIQVGGGAYNKYVKEDQNESRVANSTLSDNTASGQ